VFEQLQAQRIPTVLVTHDPSDVPPGARVIELGTQEAADA
jgi:putative thiamine transport system ATP-binding protein